MNEIINGLINSIINNWGLGIIPSMDISIIKGLLVFMVIYALVMLTRAIKEGIA